MSEPSQSKCIHFKGVMMHPKSSLLHTELHSALSMWPCCCWSVQPVMSDHRNWKASCSVFTICACMSLGVGKAPCECSWLLTCLKLICKSSHADRQTETCVTRMRVLLTCYIGCNQLSGFNIPAHSASGNSTLHTGIGEMHLTCLVGWQTGSEEWASSDHLQLLGRNRAP